MRNEVFQGTSLRTLVQMVANGLGLTLVPRLAVPTEVPAKGPVKAVPLAAGHNSRTIALVWRRSSARAAAFRKLGECLRLRAT